MTKTNEMLPSGNDRGEPEEAQRPLRILVADDDRDAVVTLMTILRHEGYDTRGVYKGISVLKILRSYEPHAVVLDISMPELNGYDVARAIQVAHWHKNPLLIGASGVYKKRADEFLARMVGFDHYLTKPYEPNELLKLIEPLKFLTPGSNPG
jgi:DNA-binding response OmpR family regulator